MSNHSIIYLSQGFLLSLSKIKVLRGKFPSQALIAQQNSPGKHRLEVLYHVRSLHHLVVLRLSQADSRSEVSHGNFPSQDMSCLEESTVFHSSYTQWAQPDKIVSL